MFLAADARRFGAPDLVAYFRRRSVLSAVGFVVVGAVALGVMRYDARHIFDGMWGGWGLAFTLAAPAMAVVTGLLMYVGRTKTIRWSVSRLTAVAAVGSAVFAWGVAQRPYLLPTTLTIEEAAASPPTLHWLLIVIGVAIVLVTPALVLLYRLDVRGELEADHDQDLTTP